MESGNQQFDRFFKLVASVVTLVTNGKRNIEKVNEALQQIVSESQKAYTLHLFGKQKTGGYEIGFDIEKHLIAEQLLDRCFSLEDELVKGWLADPSTYPEEFKGKAIFLWKSTRTSGADRKVACLCWDDGGVIVDWRWLGDGWGGRSPALLASHTEGGASSLDT